MKTNFYHYPCEPDNDWGFFIDLDLDDVNINNVFLKNHNTDIHDSIYYENTNADIHESINNENTNTNRCELFIAHKQKIDYLTYFTTQLCISGFIIYTYFNTKPRTY